MMYLHVDVPILLAKVRREESYPKLLPKDFSCKLEWSNSKAIGKRTSWFRHHVAYASPVFFDALSICDLEVKWNCVEWASLG